MEQSYGFVTLATGADLYYKSAYWLLQSYRYHNGKGRFCIICDRENKYTRAFDDVVVLENCHFNYLDKFELLRKAPYEKNIFIEPDCLAYRNLDDFWEMFKDATPVSAFGFNDADIGTWFKDKEQVRTIFNVECFPNFNPGYLYIQKSHITNQCYHDLIEISKRIANSQEFSGEEKIFNGLSLRDDPVFCIAMERNNCSCAVEQSVGKCLSVPSVVSFVELKISEGKLSALYNLNGTETQLDDCYILHFSSRRLKECLYFQQVLVLRCLRKSATSYFSGFFESQFFSLVLKKLFKIKSEVKHILKK